MTFVTFRLTDSMPKFVVERWLAELREWLEGNRVDLGPLDSERRATAARDRRVDELPKHLRRAFVKFKNQRWHEHLDDCHGSCLLRRPEFGTIVADSLLKFNEDRYDIDRFVVMPNHVHLLVQMRVGWRLREQCESWMRFTARRINALRKIVGKVWSEPFDHIVRNEGQFEYLRRYIEENPANAKLSDEDYLLWVHGSGFVLSHASPRRVTRDGDWG
ncbi:MAG: hypothetical protein FJ297_12700 [Planctomycetes bacterium]|nr:hypothetical protein [Planctomycetota bacterium]